MLISNRTSHMGFQLLPKSVTLNDLERHNGSYFALFHRIRQLWDQLRQVDEDSPYCLQQKCSPKNLVVSNA